MPRVELMPFISLMHFSGPQVNPSDFVVDGSQNYDMKVHGALGNTSILNRYMLDVVIVLWLVDEELMDGLGILIWFHFELFLKLQVVLIYEYCCLLYFHCKNTLLIEAAFALTVKECLS